MKEDNKVVDKNLLTEYGFKQIEEKTKEFLTVMAKDTFEVIVTAEGAVFYSNMGFDYPLKDLATLKKVYKEVKRKELLE